MIDHGIWTVYTPTFSEDDPRSKLPISNILWLKNANNDDWYDYVKTLSNGVYGTVDSNNRILMADTDPTKLVPVNIRFIEFDANTNPESIINHGIDLSANTITTDPVLVLKQTTITYKADIWRRCTDDEADSLETLLSQQTTRKQRLFNDAQFIAHDDPFYTELLAGITQMLGETRANEILASSNS